LRGGRDSQISEASDINESGPYLLYVFITGHKDKLKASYWHRNGFCLQHKRGEGQVRRTAQAFRDHAERDDAD